MAGRKFQDPLEIMWQMLKECLQRRQGGCISLMLLLGLSSRGLWLHIWTRRARHSRKGSMAASLPRCCFHALQGCLPAWPGCSFSPASAGRHLASADRQPQLHHSPCPPSDPLQFPGVQADQMLGLFGEGSSLGLSQNPGCFLILMHSFHK